MTIWYILWLFGNLVVIWYIFTRFGTLYQVNLATLFWPLVLWLLTRFRKEDFSSIKKSPRSFNTAIYFEFKLFFY
jgi:hypothetical protein